MDKILRNIKRFLPNWIFHALQPIYHYVLALLGAVIYRAPSRKLYVIGITGTKGKSSTSEITNAILEEAGEKTAMVNGIRFKVGDDSVPNQLKMTMPGRFTIQKYMREAVRADCKYFILEMTSEGTKQFRHKFIALDALIFTNLSPEHIEAHGSYEKYRDAKLKIAKALEGSKKVGRVIVANRDDKESGRFLDINVPNKLTFSLDDAKIFRILPEGVEITFSGERIESKLRGQMNIYNMLAGATLARFLGVNTKTIKKALFDVSIPGRLQYVRAGQDFDVIVDYAHTADYLRQVYEIFPKKNKICILGSTGGGRDKSKRKNMGEIADEHCSEVILTNEDPYDEDPRKIIDDVAQGITRHKPHIYMDRREAMRAGFALAQKDDVVIITGKGTDPYIMIENGQKIPWSDARIAKEELEKFQSAEKE
jgi:UDP-N-acetylmuramoyl-L-alanyl-D-glutamate--2,6-diaminopimelate ligase